MPNKSRRSPSPEEIAEMATRGEDVSKFFTNQFTVVRPVRRVNVDLTQGMLRELDERAARLNVSRQAVIKTLLRNALDHDRPTRRPGGAGERADRGRSRR
jgi:Ribbon-helix-helix protein, copG family